MKRGSTTTVLPLALSLALAAGACASKGPIHFEDKTTTLPDDRCWTVTNRTTTTGKGKKAETKIEEVSREFSATCGEQDKQQKITAAYAHTTEELGREQAAAWKTVELARIASEQNKTVALTNVYSRTLVQMIAAAPAEMKRDIYKTVLTRMDSSDPMTRKSQKEANDAAGIEDKTVREGAAECMELRDPNGQLVLSPDGHYRLVCG